MKTETSKTNNIKVFIIIALAISIILLVIDRFNQTSKTNIIIEDLENTNTEKVKIDKELKDMVVQYDNLKTNNDTLNAQLNKEQEKVKEIIKKLKYVRASNSGQVKIYKAELETLRKIMRSYIVQIDSLYTKNKALISENKQVRNQYQQAVDANEDLSYERDSLAGTVKMASALKAVNIKAIGLNERNKETNRINKLFKIKICCTIDENNITEKGSKYVYIRIVKPDKYIIVESEDNLFDFEGKQIAYTSRSSIYYSGKKTDMCIYWKKSETLKPGLYYADIFTENQKIGTMAFRLK